MGKLRPWGAWLMYPEDQSAAGIQPVSPEPWHRKDMRELWVHRHSIHSFLDSNPWETQEGAIRNGTRAYRSQWKSFQLFQQASGTSPWCILWGCLLPALCGSLTTKLMVSMQLLNWQVCRYLCLSFHCKQQLKRQHGEKNVRGERSAIASHKRKQLTRVAGPLVHFFVPQEPGRKLTALWQSVEQTPFLSLYSIEKVAWSCDWSMLPESQYSHHMQQVPRAAPKMTWVTMSQHAAKFSFPSHTRNSPSWWSWSKWHQHTRS